MCRDYLMDMCDLVPVRNRCRALYLQCAAYICRRVEFVDGYPLDGQQIRVDEEGKGGCQPLQTVCGARTDRTCLCDAAVAKRYYKLLERSVRYCANKMRKTRILAEEHRFFVVHIFATVFFRFPFTTSPILSAIEDCMERLEETQQAPQSGGAAGTARTPRRRRRPFQVPVASCRSPRGHRRDWNTLSGKAAFGVGVRLNGHLRTELGAVIECAQMKSHRRNV